MEDFGETNLDGVWRPYGTDLPREAAHLIHQFPAARGRLDRLACSPADWDVVEPYVFTDHGKIPVGVLPDGYSHMVLARIAGGPIIRLRVIPGWEPDVA